MIVASEATKKARLEWGDFYDPGGADLFDKARGFQAALAQEAADGNHFFRRPILAADGGRALVRDPEDGRVREVIMLGSNSFLGLSTHPRVVEASRDAARQYGFGTGAVSLYAGTTDLHVELERRIAAFYRVEDAILFPTGYAANVGIITALLRKGDAVVNDLFNHASIFDGCIQSGAALHTFAHGRMRHLERALKRATGPDHGTLVITDGVFSMEGETAKLDEIVPLARKYGARVMIDEAHAVGVVGPTGRGTAEKCGVEGEIDVVMGTLSKAPGGIGGYAAGSRELIDYLRYFARPYFFSTSIPAPVIAGLLEVFDILANDPTLHRALWRNIQYLRGELDALGFNTGKSASAIIPIIGRDEAAVKGMLRDLFAEGIFANYVAFPAVPKNRPRIRVNVMAQHTRKELDEVLEAFERLGKKHGIIE
ncbi:MAG: aminotransferase class I/II-fold pyridoxal phosphate-dependent enzyme [Planctomycetota bacterium]